MNHETTSAKRRPTLLADARNETDEAREPDCGPVSILSSIDAPKRGPRKHRAASAPKPRKTRKWGGAVTALAVVAAVVAGLVYVDSEGMTFLAEAPAASPATRVAAAPPAQTRAASVSQPPAGNAERPEEAPPQSAVIETIAAAPSATKEDPFSSLAPAVEAVAPAAVAAAAAPAAVPAEPAVAAAPVKTTHASRPAKRAATPTKRSDTRLAKSAPAQKDPDVELIEALMSHVAGKGAAPVRRDAGLKLADAGTANQQARDVVLQQEPALPTGELVRRCMTLGWLESQLCRARICSGQWGQDAACPLAQQQSADFRR